MHQQEATRAETVSWLRAGHTVKEIMSYGDFNKNTVVGEGDLASQLTCLQPFGLFGVGRLWIKGQSKVSQQIQGSDLKVMGSLARDTVAKACMSFRSRIEALFTADGSCIECVDCQYVPLLKKFYFNKIGWFSAVLPFKRKKKKIPNISLPPCTVSTQKKNNW